jgi:hypothetical protein
MEIDADALARNSQGIPKTQQICHDNDPTCDLNPAVGTCQLRVWNCLGAANAALGCSEQAVSALEARQPKTTSKRPHEVAARAALDAALAEFSLPAGPGEECNSGMTLDLPVGPAMSLKLKATMAVGEDSDTLKLRCMP